jgi:hypothetical protein
MASPSSAPVRVELPADLAQAIAAAGTELLGSASMTTARRAPTRGSGETLRPGPHTPLWNALAAQLRPLLKPRGEKATLARALGVPRQTVSMWVSSHTRMPDAERTLLLIAWITAKRASPPPLV